MLLLHVWLTCLTLLSSSSICWWTLWDSTCCSWATGTTDNKDTKSRYQVNSVSIIQVGQVEFHRSSERLLEFRAEPVIGRKIKTPSRSHKQVRFTQLGQPGRPRPLEVLRYVSQASRGLEEKVHLLDLQLHQVEQVQSADKGDYLMWSRLCRSALKPSLAPDGPWM